MSPTACTLALLGWQLYNRRAKVHGMMTDRVMLLGESRWLTNEFYHRMVMGWPEVMSGERIAIVQIISVGTVRKECGPRDWGTIPHSELAILASPVLRDLTR